jgi:hypothetical protein
MLHTTFSPKTYDELTHVTNGHSRSCFCFLGSLKESVSKLRVILAALSTLLALICWLYAQASVQVGYSVYTADSGYRIPVGSALFRVTNAAGIVVSEAGVGAAEPIRSGRIFVDEVATRTGLALVNTSALQAAALTFTLRDSTGVQVDQTTASLGAKQHLARFVDELFKSGKAAGLRGSLTVESSQPVAAVTLREKPNQFGEHLYTTLPVVDLSAPLSTGSIVFPHIAAGGGYTTELLLINPGTQAMRGDVRFYGSDGQPLSLQNGGQTVSQIAYNIAANGTFRAVVDSTALQSGWATAIPAVGTSAPSGSVIFQYSVNNQVVTEAGVAATLPTPTARVFVDNAGTHTGIAIANPSISTAEVALTLMDRTGVALDTENRSLPPGSHMALFADELFPSSVADGFTGLLEIRSSVDVSAVTLKLTTNGTRDLVITTLPVADLTRASTATSLIFPHIAMGGGYSMRLVLINTDTTLTSSGRLIFSHSDGTPMVVPLASGIGSDFAYQISAGGGRQFYPGNSARVARIAVVDPSDGRVTKEIAINEGNTVRPALRVTDTSGAARDDFDVTIQSLDAAIASVDSTGGIRGERAGFSTLTLTAQGVIATATATVVRVNSGSGLGVLGVVQDFSNRLYLASSSEHAVLLAQEIRQTPELYAGIPRSPGLRNGARLNSQFSRPSFLALDQAQGSLYVSDGGNNVIRKVGPGASGQVETIAGNGSVGSQDGPVNQAGFSNPQGVAIDGRGNLWVADSGNHTIRRINLQSGTVETIAGTAGVPGLIDGVGREARFREPAGLVIQSETTAHQLDRERLGLPAPPVQVLVADSGNNVIRRVTETGQVETLGSSNVTSILAESPKASFKTATVPVAPLILKTPLRKPEAGK